MKTDLVLVTFRIGANLHFLALPVTYAVCPSPSMTRQRIRDGPWEGLERPRRILERLPALSLHGVSVPSGPLLQR